MSVLGFDTSNYTTSIAFFDGNGGLNCSQLLPVKAGELGLRVSATGSVLPCGASARWQKN